MMTNHKPAIDQTLHVERIAAFSDGNRGGNPAGVVICARLPDASRMQSIAAEVGFSETAFAAPADQGWRVRYFAPATEVPFCGHATIALGAALARRFGDGTFALTLNDTAITVTGKTSDGAMQAALQSPATSHTPAPAALLQAALGLFSYTAEDLDGSVPASIVRAGAQHLLLTLSSREALARMHYELAAGKQLMEQWQLTTILLAYAESPALFHCRNAFAIGGVLEDPATGAASAALAGFLRDSGRLAQSGIRIIQGEDMGMRSLIDVEALPQTGSSIRVSGQVRLMDSPA